VNLRIGLGLALLAAALDQLTKWWIVTEVMRPPQVIEVTPFFNLVLGYNRGVSFGMFNMHGDTGRWLLAGLAATITIALIVWMWRAENPWIAGALGLIIGGAVGNLWDRVFVGAVVDFLDFHAAGYHWPAFNIADSAIFCGAAILIWDSFVTSADDA